MKSLGAVEVDDVSLDSSRSNSDDSSKYIMSVPARKELTQSSTNLRLVIPTLPIEESLRSLKSSGKKTSSQSKEKSIQGFNTKQNFPSTNGSSQLQTTSKLNATEFQTQKVSSFNDKKNNLSISGKGSQKELSITVSPTGALSDKISFASNSKADPVQIAEQNDCKVSVAENQLLGGSLLLQESKMNSLSSFVQNDVIESVKANSEIQLEDSSKLNITATPLNPIGIADNSIQEVGTLSKAENITATSNFGSYAATNCCLPPTDKITSDVYTVGAMLEGSESHQSKTSSILEPAESQYLKFAKTPNLSTTSVVDDKNTAIKHNDIEDVSIVSSKSLKIAVPKPDDVNIHEGSNLESVIIRSSKQPSVALIEDSISAVSQAENIKTIIQPVDSLGRNSISSTLQRSSFIDPSPAALLNHDSVAIATMPSPQSSTDEQKSDIKQADSYHPSLMFPLKSEKSNLPVVSSPSITMNEDPATIGSTTEKTGNSLKGMISISPRRTPETNEALKDLVPVHNTAVAIQLPAIVSPSINLEESSGSMNLIDGSQTVPGGSRSQSTMRITGVQNESSVGAFPSTSSGI